MKTRVVTVGNHRGNPRLWLEGAWLTDAGFKRGDFYTMTIDAALKIVTLRVDVAGSRKVSGKTKGLRDISVIDINASGFEFLGSRAVVTIAALGHLVIAKAGD